MSTTASLGEPSKLLPTAQRIRYFASYSESFSNPDFVPILLYASLAGLIPVLNQILLLGYLYNIIELRHRRLIGHYPKFEFSQFSFYLQRGVWPFLIAFIIQMILNPVIQVVMQVSIFGSMAIMQADEEVGAIVLAIAIPSLILMFLVFCLLASLVLTPILLRAGLSQDFAQGFNFNWIKDFIRRCWFETLLVNIFATIVALVLVLAGAMVFCIGAVPASIIAMLGSAGLTVQLYELYLARGGEPIPLKPLPTDLPPVASAPPVPNYSPDFSASPPEKPADPVPDDTNRDLPPPVA